MLRLIPALKLPGSYPPARQFVVGVHADEQSLRRIVARVAATHSEWGSHSHVTHSRVSILVQTPEPRFQVSTALATDLGYITLLDALEPIACECPPRGLKRVDWL